MKRFLAILVLVSMLFCPFFCAIAIAQEQESEEILVLKRDLLTERVIRIRTQLALMETQYDKGETALREAQEKLKEINSELAKLQSEKSKKEEKDDGVQMENK